MQGLNGHDSRKRGIGGSCPSDKAKHDPQGGSNFTVRLTTCSNLWRCQEVHALYGRLEAKVKAAIEFEEKQAAASRPRVCGLLGCVRRVSLIHSVFSDSVREV